LPSGYFNKQKCGYNCTHGTSQSTALLCQNCAPEYTCIGRVSCREKISRNEAVYRFAIGLNGGGNCWRCEHCEDHTEILNCGPLISTVGLKVRDLINENKMIELQTLINRENIDVNASGLKYGVRHTFETTLNKSQSYLIRVTNRHNMLTFAISYNKPKIVEMLLEKGADVDYKIKVDDQCFYALTIGLAENHNDDTERESLLDIVTLYLHTGISEEHYNQALEFIKTVVRPYVPEYAEKLEKLFLENPYKCEGAIGGPSW
jgi:hypothetical protein